MRKSHSDGINTLPACLCHARDASPRRCWSENQVDRSRSEYRSTFIYHHRLVSSSPADSRVACSHVYKYIYDTSVCLSACLSVTTVMCTRQWRRDLYSCSILNKHQSLSLSLSFQFSQFVNFMLSSIATAELVLTRPPPAGVRGS